jgi:glycosyltransferase involved in cell wall biosynthesis
MLHRRRFHRLFSVRCIFLHSAREWSGTARVFVAAARGLAERGHTVAMAVEPDSTVERIASQVAVIPGHAPLFDVEPLSVYEPWFGAALRLRTLVRLRNADVVFVHTDREHLVAAAAYRLGSGTPIVRRVSAGCTLTMHRSGRVATMCAPTYYLFSSEPDLRATTLPRRARRGIAPLGVRAGDDGSASHAQAGEYIVCLHDASSRSRAAMAIRTVAMLAPRHPALRLVVIGEGAYDEDLRMQAAALNVLHLISFLGDRGDAQQIMRDAALGWVVSESDTAAYGMLDLMNAGIPVLAAEGTVAERYILSEITGVLLPPTDAYLAAATVANLLTSTGERETMGHAARARVVREFPESAMIDGFERAAAAIPARHGH